MIISIRTAVFRKSAIIALIFLVTGSACTQARKSSPDATPATSPSKVDSFAITSTAFKEGARIPRQYTCDGVNVSPPLEWIGVPKTARTLAIIADDPDAPSGTWVHWVLYNIPADNIGFVENLPSTQEIKGGGFQGKNDFKQIGYGGPCPPSGTHRYFFKLYALDSDLPLKDGATKSDVETAMSGHIVGQAQLMGTYR
jgi:Raf kinase inhibitor-like YbhB/YbcL family protein